MPTDRDERRRISGGLDTCKAVPSVRRQQPREVAGFCERGPMGQRPAQVLAKCSPHLSGGHPGSLQHGPERRVRVGQAERLQVGRVAIRVAAQQNEVACVRDEHQPVPVPVAADLAALGCQQRVVIRRLDLDDSALRGLALARCSSLHLAGSVEAEIGVTRALVCQLRHTDDLRPERRANGVEQVGQRRIGGDALPSPHRMRERGAGPLGTPRRSRSVWRCSPSMAVLYRTPRPDAEPTAPGRARSSPRSG